MPKRAKLLQYAERVWNITDGSDDARIDAAIEATRHFFESLGVPTRLSGYGLDGSSIPALLAKLEAHGMTQIGEHGDITPGRQPSIYEAGTLPAVFRILSFSVFWTFRPDLMTSHRRRFPPATSIEGGKNGKPNRNQATGRQRDAQLGLGVESR